MTNSNAASERVDAPLEKASRIVAEPFLDFINAQSASGWVLLAATLLAIAFANSPWGHWYTMLLDFKLGITFEDQQFALTLKHWVNDGLMALFFFLLGLELKRELLVGKLSDIKSASSVLWAALGGIAVPALVYLSLVSTTETHAGWAIPMATDTAFALMILVLLGDRIPTSARAFLVGLAIVDDLAAIMVIAIGYTDNIQLAWILPALGAAATLVLLNLIGIRNGIAYFFVGAVLWLILLQLGLHGTLAGVIVALTAPIRPALARPHFANQLKEKVSRFEDEHNKKTATILEQPKQHKIAHDVMDVATQATAPLSRWERRIEGPISFAVMPIFAFMNAGVIMNQEAFTNAWSSELSFAILLALLLGKPFGILLGVWIGRLTGWAAVPDNLSLSHIFGLGLLGGIGFTMSLFIATLSFGEGSNLLAIAKQSIILSSTLAGVVGFVWLRWFTKNKE